MDHNLAGIPLITNQYMPENELWLITRGKKKKIHVHEGPKAGEVFEVWIQKPRIVRLINLTEPEIKWNLTSLKR